MKTWLFVIGLVFFFFGFFPPFHLMTVVIGFLLALAGLILKSNKKDGVIRR